MLIIYLFIKKWSLLSYRYVLYVKNKLNGLNIFLFKTKLKFLVFISFLSQINTYKPFKNKSNFIV